MWNCMTWMRTCLFLRLVYFEVSEATLSCTAMVYFCIKWLTEVFTILLFDLRGEREEEITPSVESIHYKIWWEEKKTTREKKKLQDYFPFKAGVERCPFPVSGVWLPQNMRLTSKLPCTSEMTNTVLHSVHPAGTLPKYLHLLLLASRFKTFGSSQRLQFHAFQYNPSRG